MSMSMSMLNEHEAVELLYYIMGTELYNSASSWTSIQEFTQDTIQRKIVNQFVLDERFVTLAEPDSNARL